MLERPLIGVFGVAKFSKRPCALVIRSRRVLCYVRLTSLFRFPNHCSPFQAGCCSLWNDRSSLSSGLLPLRKGCGLFRTVSKFIQSALVCLGGSCYFGTQLLKKQHFGIRPAVFFCFSIFSNGLLLFSFSDAPDLLGGLLFHEKFAVVTQIL